MGEILGVGLSHYPPLCGPDEKMAGLLRGAIADETIPEAERMSANWSKEMQHEWGDDDGVGAAKGHRDELVAEFRRVRTAIDDFNPDVLLIIGDDQYENFREDIIPPFTVLAYDDDLETQPWKASAASAMVGAKNAWDEPADTTFTVRMAPDFGREIATGLIERDIDAAYAYEPHHHQGLSHAFANALLYLDYDRTGLDYPVLPLAVNCYGRHVISRKGFVAPFGEKVPFDPPSPSPKRMMAVGAALADTIMASDWRVALVASSSWSHAFLCDKTYRMRPDHESDEALYAAMQTNDFASIGSTPLGDVEAAGQHEVLNWFALWGAMDRAGIDLSWSSMVRTSVFNSNKVFAVY